MCIRDSHTPESISNAMGLIAALLLGQFAIDLGFFSEEILLFCAVGSIGGFATPNYELSLTNKYIKVMMILSVMFLNIFGFVIFNICLWIYLARLKPFGMSYFCLLYTSAGIASAMGAKVQYYSTSGRNATSDYQQVNFETLLKSSDIISIHAPLNENTKYLFDEKALRQMKENAYLINVGRGGIIEEEALVKVLNEGHLSGVGLDVFEHEPLLEDDVLYTIKDMSKVRCV